MITNKQSPVTPAQKERYGETASESTETSTSQMSFAFQNSECIAQRWHSHKWTGLPTPCLTCKNELELTTVEKELLIHVNLKAEYCFDGKKVDNEIWSI